MLTLLLLALTAGPALAVPRTVHTMDYVYPHLALTHGRIALREPASIFELTFVDRQPRKRIIATDGLGAAAPMWMPRPIGAVPWLLAGVDAPDGACTNLLTGQTVALLPADLCHPSASHVLDLNADDVDDLLHIEVEATELEVVISGTVALAPFSWVSRIHQFHSTPSGHELLVDELPGRVVPIGDIDRDGFPDLLAFHDQFEFTEDPWWGATVATPLGTDVSLHLGGPQGFDAEPVWRHSFERRVHEALAAQLDEDDELEILLLEADLDTWAEPEYRDIEFFQIDHVGGEPVVSKNSNLLYSSSRDRMVRSQFFWTSVGDWDGDGLDDIVVDHYLRASSLGYSGVDIMAPVRSDATWRALDAVDLDGDGVRDLVLLTTNGGSRVSVFWGRSPDAPIDTGTPDTGAHDTSTHPTDDTTPSASRPGPADPACGCRAAGPAGAWLLLPVLALTRRRTPWSTRRRPRASWSSNPSTHRFMDARLKQPGRAEPRSCQGSNRWYDHVR